MLDHHRYIRMPLAVYSVPRKLIKVLRLTQQDNSTGNSKVCSPGIMALPPVTFAVLSADGPGEFSEVIKVRHHGCSITLVWL